uniref:PX domain-containing protein kinase-like protein n=1 Tax=Nyssomyia neivai TaxID=330878 RepID=A0A1L8DK95_9DIPT
MAIFEKRIERKVNLDDTEEIKCFIETAQNVNGHTEYVLRVQRGPLSENSWRLLRRYNDFRTLDKSLQISGIDLPLPAKKIIGNMHPEFIAQRRLALQEYINHVLMNPILASSLPTKKFVDPDSYCTPFHDLALQNASLCLRADGQYALGQSLGPIGWRLRKHYFRVTMKLASGRSSPGQTKHLVKTISQSHARGAQQSNGSTPSGAQEHILAWTEYGPDKYIDDREIHSTLKNLGGVQHPYIQPLEYVTSNDNGALVIRKFSAQGSLKDMLCSVQPVNPFLTKYGNPKGRSPLPLKDVALYGRQILEAIKFLHTKGLPNGHVHAGNVVIINGTARLLDIENFILGVPAFYRPFFMQHSRINTFEAVDVYSFGHLLYEMTMGYPLQESVARQITDCPDSLRQLLESLLLRDSCKNGLPSLDQVAQHPFFQEHVPNFADTLAKATRTTKTHIKWSSNAKEQLKLAVQKSEHRFREEQKSVRNQKRLVRVQEWMSSEEEKKKIKTKAKMEQKQSKLRQQTSLQLQNGPPVAPLTLTRSDSANSVSTSHETDSPLPPPPPPSLPNLSRTTDDINVPGTSGERGRYALLDSICKFNKSSLRRVASDE